MIKYLIDGKIVADKIDNMINSVIDIRRDIANGLLMANQEICKACIEDRVEAIPVEWLKNELIPKAEKLGATTYVDNIKFVLEDWEAWKKYR